MPPTLTLAPPVFAGKSPPLPTGKRTMLERLTGPGSDTPVRSLPSPGTKTPDTPLNKRFTSLSLATSEAPLTDGPDASAELCSAEFSTPAADSAHTLHSAFTALAFGGLCSPEQVATLRKQYGSLKGLIPSLGKTFMAVDDLSLSNPEWHEVIKTWPLALAKVPKAVRCDTLYVEALCASAGSAKVIALLPTEDKEYKENLCIQAFRRDPALIGLLPIARRTPEICKAACILRPQALVHVPKGVQTQAFFLHVCAKNPDFFCELTDGQKTKSQAMLVCKKRGDLLAEVPLALRDKAVCETACFCSSSAISSVPDHICTEAFCLALVMKSPTALQYIPADKMTIQMCESACAEWPRGLECVPVGLRTVKLYQNIFAHPHFYRAYPYFPTALVRDSVCEQMCEMSASNLQEVPDSFKNKKLYRIATTQPRWNLSDILQADRTRELCIKSGLGGGCDFVFVPDDHIDLNFLFSVMGGKDNLDLHLRAQKWLSTEDYTTFLCVSALYRTETQLKLLTWPGLPDCFRRRLVDFLAGLGEPITPQSLPQHPLINPHNPLRFHMYNPFVAKLLLQAHNAAHYQPACQADGQAWLHYLEQQLPRYTDSPLPLIDTELYAPLQRGSCEAKGGRTVQVKDGDMIYYYKFQRTDEPLADLVREGLIHQFRAEHAPGAWSKLASDLPKDPHFFALPKSMWPQQTDEFTDTVEEQQKDGREPWANVYRYTASADYGRYAHQPHSEADCRWKKPEDAILTACYDMGLFASMGLMLTSMLPAFHDSRTNRSWQTLYDLFGYRDQAEMHPGTFGGWNGKATEYCDIGFSGLRDIGDYEQFGAIRSCFRKSDNDGTAQPLEVGQRLAVVSTLCDNVMAAILIRSRLRQQDWSYHYRQSEAVADTARFISDVCDRLLTGLAGKGKDEVQLGITAKTMGYTQVQYGEWLQRTALEIVYWTADQPALHSGKSTSPAFSGYKKEAADLQDGWVLHLQEGKNLSSTLYDPAEFRPGWHSFPYNFRNPHEEDNLGAHSSVFPFTSLVQGLTSLGGNILAQGSTAANDMVMVSD